MSVSLIRPLLIQPIIRSLVNHLTSVSSFFHVKWDQKHGLALPKKIIFVKVFKEIVKYFSNIIINNSLSAINLSKLTLLYLSLYLSWLNQIFLWCYIYSLLNCWNENQPVTGHANSAVNLCLLYESGNSRL